MRAALIDKPLSFVFTDVPEPQITRPDEVKIHVHVTGICGSEVHAYHGTHPFRIPPIVSGHEFAGTVVETGKDVTVCKTGDRVTAEPHYGCGECSLCRDGKYNICEKKRVLGSGEWTGSFGEYIVVPESTVIPLPGNLSFEAGALIEPLAVAMHAVRTSGIGMGDSICIIGCGPIGLSILLCAKMAGVSRIIVSDALEANLRMAREMGSTDEVNPLKQNLREEVRRLTGAAGTDVTFLAFGNRQVYDDALSITRRGGAISQIALMDEPFPIDIAKTQQKEMRILGSNMYLRRDFEIVRDALSDGRLKAAEAMISEILPIEQAAEAMEMADKKTKPVVKVLLRFV